MDGLGVLGAKVRECRSGAGLSGAELARRAGVSQPSVWRVESGRRLSDVAVVERIARALALDGAAENELLALARVAYGESARQRVDSGVSMIAGQFSRHLSAAGLVRSFSSSAVPGLLRTESYAAAAGAATGADAAVVADPAKAFAFVMTDAVLRTWPDGADMRGQLNRLAELARRPNVRVGVIEGGAALPRLPLHGFTVAGDSAVLVETFTAELTLTNPDDVAAYAGCFADFEAAAVFGVGALDLIATAAGDWARLAE